MEHNAHRGLDRGWRIAMLLLVSACLPAGTMAAPGGCADPPADTGESLGSVGAHILYASTLDLSCRPPLLHALEGQWTFFLEGDDALGIVRGELHLGEETYPAVTLRRPTPHSVLLDFQYPAVRLGTDARLDLYSATQQTPVESFELAVTPSLEVAPENRQADLVRVQLEQGALQYLLHDIKPGDPVRERHLNELSGDPQLMEALRDLGVERLRKIMPRYAEDDSIHWDPRYLRDIVYRGKQLRQYVFYLDEGLSEAAYKEILLGVPRVEKAFVNEDKRKTRRH